MLIQIEISESLINQGKCITDCLLFMQIDSIQVQFGQWLGSRLARWPLHNTNMKKGLCLIHLPTFMFDNNTLT